MKEALRIAVVCYPSLGGSGVVASELAHGLARKGHAVHLIAGAPLSRPLPPCERLTFQTLSVSEYPPFENPPYAMAVAAGIISAVRERPLDLINVHYAAPHAASAYLAGKVLGRLRPRCVTTLHGTDVTRIDVDQGYREITGFSIAESDGITVPSEFLRSEAYRVFACPPDTQIDVIPNFVDTDRFAPAESRDPARFDRLFSDTEGAKRGPVLFHVSNFRSVKRTGDLIDVLARVRERIPARLVLVGDGPERAKTAGRARELGVQRAVCFLGRRVDFTEYLNQSDAFVLTSETESFGVAALEALSCAVPVFGYRVGGLPDVVAEGAGALVEPFDVTALSRAIVEHLADSAASQAGRRRAARDHVLAHFRSEPAIDRYEAYFRTVLEAPARELA